MGANVDKALARAPPHCLLFFWRRVLMMVLMFSVMYTGHSRTLSVFIGGRDRVGSRDTGNAATRRRLLLLS